MRTPYLPFLDHVGCLMLSGSPSAASFHPIHLISLFFIALLLLGEDEIPRSAGGHSNVHVRVGFMRILSPFLRF